MSQPYYLTAEYNSTHRWLARKYGKATHCEEDASHRGVYEWSNTSGSYKRERSDWRMLCKRCHAAFDLGVPYEREDHDHWNDRYTFPDGRTECRTCKRRNGLASYHRVKLRRENNERVL